MYRRPDELRITRANEIVRFPDSKTNTGISREPIGARSRPIAMPESESKKKESSKGVEGRRDFAFRSRVAR